MCNLLLRKYHLLSVTDITQEAERVIKSICYERFSYQTTACNEILLDWFNLPQQPDELCLFGKSGGSSARPTLPRFVFGVSIFETDVGMVCNEFGQRWLLNLSLELKIM